MRWSPLLRWYAKEKRDLPWRKTHDPYRILVSEVMLQQTQVSRVLDFYKRWLKQFPTWRALARASNAEIIHAWAGLGYNRRGLMLREIAKQVVKNGVPKTEQEWLELKGIGPYTAAAISAFAQGQNTIPIDTNIRRVLGRVLLGKPFPDLKDDKRIHRIVGARRAVPLHADHFQAIFDLAVAVCKKNPNCAICPMRMQCPASKKFLSGRVRIPKQMIKKNLETKHRNKPFPDRIYRGRILKEVRLGHGDLKTLGTRIDPSFMRSQDQAWLNRMLTRMQKDGFVRIIGSRIQLM
jgi:A/G-specific adenine glycosylase